MEGVHHLSRDFSLTNISDLILENGFESTVNIFCSNDGRFVFKNIETIAINNVSVADCYGNSITNASYVALTDVVVESISQNSSEVAFYLINIQDFKVIGCRFAFITAIDLPYLSCAVLDVVNSNVTIYHSLFDQNSAQSADNIGCVLCSRSSMVAILESSFTNNTVVYSEANVVSSTLLIVNSDLTIQDSSFVGNQAKTGGVVYGENSTISAVRTTFAENHATSSGGAAYLDSSNFTLELCNLTENSCDKYGGVIDCFKKSIIEVSRSMFLHNFALGTAGDDTGYGGVVHAEDNVTITISSSTFVHNSAVSGGCASIKNSILWINSSNFENNTGKLYGGAFTIVRSKLHIQGCDDWVRFVGNSAQHGGALNIVEGTVAHIQCTLFENNNASYRGGAILVRTDTKVYLVDTKFYENSAIGKGGALFAQFSLIESTGDLIVEKNRAENGTIYITSCSVNLVGNISFVSNVQSLFAHNSEITFANDSTFRSNDGMSNNSLEGGAITAVSSNLNIWGNVLIENNKAKYGGGIKLTNSVLDVEKCGEFTLQNNFADEGGALNVHNSPIQLRGHTTFEDNMATNAGGAIYMVSSIINFYSTSRLVSFSNNSAELGGAIYFDRTSSQYILKEKAECEKDENDKKRWYCNAAKSEWMVLSFVDNSAKDKGGALYVDDEAATTCSNKSSDPIYKECFIQTIAVYEKANDWVTTGFNYANIKFLNNTAEGQGSLLYGGLLDRCAVSEYAELRDNSSIVNASPLTYFDTLIINSTTNFSDSEIASDPVRVCFCEYDKTINCTKTLDILSKPGQGFIITLLAVNQLCVPVESKVIAYLSGNVSSHLGEDQLEHNIDATCTDLEFSVFSTHSEKLTLYADGPCADNDISHAIVDI